MRIRLSDWVVPMTLLLLVSAPSVALAQETTEIPAGEGARQALEIGESITDDLTPDNPLRLYTLSGSAGDIITITMESDEVDSYLRMGDAQGNQLLLDDDGADALNARIGPIMLPDDGDYVVVASSFDYVVSDGVELEAGEFSLTIDTVEPEEIEYPGEVEGTISEDDNLVLYSFEGEQGDVISISMESEDFDSYLFIEEANNLTGSIVRDDDSGDDVNALIVPYILPATGTYFIAAASYQGGSEGDFTLAVTQLEALEIAYGASDETELSRSTPTLVYTFPGAEGDAVDLTVAAAGELDTTLTLIAPDGTQVVYVDDLEGRNPGLAGQVLPQDGTYTVVISPFRTGDNGELTVSLSLAE